MNYKILSVVLTLILILFFINIFSHFGAKQAKNFIKPLTNGASVALINIGGVISAETSKNILTSLYQIEKNPQVKGIILAINSPGGTTGTSEEIYQELMKLRQKGIKIVSSISDLGASGGYYIASSSDEIFANGSSLTGSIGVIISTYNMKNLADKLGVKAITVTSGKMKDMLSPFRDMRPDELAYVKSMIGEIYNQFVNDVFKGRKGKITKEKLLSIADGRVFTGMDAKNYGLIDQIGGFSAAVEAMKKLLNSKDLSFIQFSNSYLEKLLKNLGKAALSIDKGLSPLSMGEMVDTFLKTHRNVPLYLSPIGGIN
jgi:protease-4